MIATLREDDPQKVETAEVAGLLFEDLPIQFLRPIQVPLLMKSDGIVE